MTENEAIKWLSEMQNPMISEAELYCAETCYGLGKMVYPEPEDYVFETAIKALEEIQQYRAIGMVEEIQKKINSLKYDCSRYEEQLSIARGEKQVYTEDDLLLEQYREIGTVEEFKELKEKSVPKIPNYEGDGYYNG